MTKEEAGNLLRNYNEARDTLIALTIEINTLFNNNSVRPPALEYQFNEAVNNVADLRNTIIEAMTHDQRISTMPDL